MAAVVVRIAIARSTTWSLEININANTLFTPTASHTCCIVWYYQWRVSALVQFASSASISTSTTPFPTKWPWLGPDAYHYLLRKWSLSEFIYYGRVARLMMNRRPSSSIHVDYYPATSTLWVSSDIKGICDKPLKSSETLFSHVSKHGNILSFEDGAITFERVECRHVTI